MARARTEGNYDMVSYMVRLSCRTLAEQALIPAFVFFFFQLYPPAWIRDPRRARPAPREAAFSSAAPRWSGSAASRASAAN